MSRKFLLSAIYSFFPPINRREKTNSLEREHEIICFMLFRNNFFHKNTVGESKAPSLLQKEKRGSAKSDASKVLSPGIGKITNPRGKFLLRTVTSPPCILRLRKCLFAAKTRKKYFYANPHNLLFGWLVGWLVVFPEIKV